MSKVQSIIEEIKGLSLLEASELVKGLEVTFGVSAAAATVAAAGAAPAAGGAAAAPAEEQTEFTVVLTAIGGNNSGKHSEMERDRRRGDVGMTKQQHERRDCEIAGERVASPYCAHVA